MICERTAGIPIDLLVKVKGTCDANAEVTEIQNCYGLRSGRMRQVTSDPVCAKCPLTLGRRGRKKVRKLRSVKVRKVRKSESQNF